MIQLDRNNNDDADKSKITLDKSSSQNGAEDIQSKNTTAEFSIKISDQLSKYSVMIFKLSGNMLQSTIPQLRSSIHAHSFAIKHVILEMKQVEMISSAGWGFLIAESKRLTDEHRVLYLTDFQPDLYQVYKSLQLHLMIKAFLTIADCLEFIDKNRAQIPKTPSSRTFVQTANAQSAPAITYSNEYINKSIISEPAKQVCYAISKHGPCSFFKLLSILQTKENNAHKIGPIKLRSILKELDLDSFEKRERYFRSC